MPLTGRVHPPQLDRPGLSRPPPNAMNMGLLIPLAEPCPDIMLHHSEFLLFNMSASMDRMLQYTPVTEDTLAALAAVRRVLAMSGRGTDAHAVDWMLRMVENKGVMDDRIEFDNLREVAWFSAPVPSGICSVRLQESRR